MNGVDLALIAIMLFALWRGWQKGFALGFIDLIVWLGSLAAAFLLFAPAAEWMKTTWPSTSGWAPLVSFLLIFFLSRLILDAIFFPLLRRIPGQEHMVNKAAGLLPGAVQGAITAMFLSAFLLMLPFSNPFSESARNSGLAKKAGDQVAKAGEWLEPLLPVGIPEVSKKMGVENTSTDRIELPFKVTDAAVRPDLEARMLELVNKERTSNGLQPLAADPELAEVARKHSRDMFARGYFAHQTPEGKSPFDRIKEGKIRFLTAGENLAMGRTIKQCHEGLMNSPGHRANILRPAFGRVGIGVLDGGIYGLMVTQNFRN